MRPGAASQATEALHRLGVNGASAAAAVARTVLGQAYASAALDVFWLSGWIMVLLIPVLWLARKAVPTPGQAVAAD